MIAKGAKRMGKDGKATRLAQRWGAMFGAEVRLKRVQQGLESQQKLAERLGYKDHGTITQIEMGNVLANFDVALELAAYLKIDLNTVMGQASGEDARPGPALAPAALPPDPLAVNLMAMIDRLWPWPQAQRQAVIGMWRGMLGALEQWPPDVPPGQAPAGPPATQAQPDGSGSL